MTVARNTIWWRSSALKGRRSVSYVEYDEDGSRRTIIEPNDEFRRDCVPCHWLMGWRDKQRHCMNVSLDNARLAREIAPEQVSRYARMAMAHYREMRKNEKDMRQYWLIGWRDKQRHRMNVSLNNARKMREVAPDMVSHYARMALAHYREMRKHEKEMRRYR